MIPTRMAAGAALAVPRLLARLRRDADADHLGLRHRPGRLQEGPVRPVRGELRLQAGGRDRQQQRAAGEAGGQQGVAG